MATKKKAKKAAAKAKAPRKKTIKMPKISVFKQGKRVSSGPVHKDGFHCPGDCHALTVVTERKPIELIIVFD